MKINYSIFFFEAAHCFQSKGRNDPLDLDSFAVQVGKYNLDVTDESDSSIHQIKEIILHPDWSFNDTSYDADIAIIILATAVKMSSNIQRVCLPKPTLEDVSGDGIVVGWGKSESLGFYDNIPRKLEVPAISVKQCLLTFPQLGEIASNRTFCGGYRDEGKATCQGDSGGGFYSLDPSSDALHWNVIGIVSSGIINHDKSCAIDKYSIYTDVAKYAGWINSMINRSKQNPLTKYIEFSCGGSE